VAGARMQRARSLAEHIGATEIRRLRGTDLMGGARGTPCCLYPVSSLAKHVSRLAAMSRRIASLETQRFILGVHRYPLEPACNGCAARQGGGLSRPFRAAFLTESTLSTQ